MKQCEFPKCGRGKSRCMCEGDPVTAPTPDAVAQARTIVELCVGKCVIAQMSEEAMRETHAALDALIAAVRAECAAKVLNAPRYGRYDHEILPMEYGNLLKRDELLAALEAHP